MTKRIKFQKNLVEKNKKLKILEKTNSRKLRDRGFPMPTKNLQKTLKKTLKKPSRAPLKPSKNPPQRYFYEFWLLNATKGGARAPPLSLRISIAKTFKNVSGEGFLKVLGGRGKVF